MCGIAGIVGKEQNLPKSESIVRRMMETLRHRGPDGNGLIADREFVFGHQRLVIIDREGGGQPMETDDGRYVIIYNGEIYNYIELRQELIRLGESFHTFSDTEVLLRLFAREGIQCLNKLNGMFAFAIYDRTEHTFYAARDHFGIKPLYYHVARDGTLVFSSEIKAMFNYPGITPHVHESALQEYLTFQFCLNAKTMFQGINKLEPGTVMKWSIRDAQPTLTRYWDFNFEIDQHHTEEYYVDRLLSLLEDSVRLQLRSDVPLGTYLSGGLDSSIVTMLAGMNLGTQLSTFSGRFLESQEYDESEYAHLVANSIGAKCFDVVPTAEQFVSSMKSLMYYMDEPVAGPGLFPQYIVSKEASNHVTVILGGQGGDEVFGGYVRYVVGYLEQALKGAIYGTQEEGKHVVTLSSIIPNLSILRSYQPMMQSFWQDGLFRPMDERYYRLIDRTHDLHEILSEEVLRSRNQEQIFEEFRLIFHHPQTKSYFNKMTHFDLKTLLPALLQVEDRVSMAVSLESRVPLLDRRIVELVTTIPPAIKFQGGETKYIIKQAGRNIVPKQVLQRKDKMGFPVPLKEWLQGGPVREYVHDTLLSERSRKRGLFKPKALESLLDTEGQFGRQIWGALCLELWYQSFIDGDHVSRS